MPSASFGGPLSLMLEARVSRLLVCLVFVSCFVGCYPEPKVEPVKLTPEFKERMRNMKNPDGSPITGPSVSGRERVQKKN